MIYAYIHCPFIFVYIFLDRRPVYGRFEPYSPPSIPWLVWQVAYGTATAVPVAVRHRHHTAVCRYGTARSPSCAAFGRRLCTGIQVALYLVSICDREYAYLVNYHLCRVHGHDLGHRGLDFRFHGHYLFRAGQLQPFAQLVG